MKTWILTLIIIQGFVFSGLDGVGSYAAEQKSQFTSAQNVAVDDSRLIERDNPYFGMPDGDDWSDIITHPIKVPMVRRHGDTIYFAAASDQHYGDYTMNMNPFNPWDYYTVDDWMSHPDIEELDFVLASLGDWIGDLRDMNSVWRSTDYTWKQVTQRNSDYIRIPYFWIMGNHDISCYECLEFESDPCNDPLISEKQARQCTGINENCYAFMYGNILFIGIGQSNEMFDLSNFQKAWLEYLLERYHNHKTVLMTHVCMRNTNGNPNDKRWSSYSLADYRGFNDTTYWYNLFDNNDQIILYIHGHNHSNENNVSFNKQSASWDDNCTFVNLASTHYNRYEVGDNRDFHRWSYVFRITDEDIGAKIWHSDSNMYINRRTTVGVPFRRAGMENNVTADGMQWFSTPKQVLDGQEWTWKNRMIANDYVLELVGINAVEQLNNPDLSGCWMERLEGNPNISLRTGWYSVRGDYSPSVTNRETGGYDGCIEVDTRLHSSPAVMELAVSSSYAEGAKVHTLEGKVPYNTALAIPGKSYVFACSLRTEYGEGTVDYLISIPRFENLHEWVWVDSVIASNIPVNTVSDLYSQTFTLPYNENMWFIQPKVRFKGSNHYYMESWSLQMESNGIFTQDFNVSLNGYNVVYQGDLGINNFMTDTLPRTIMDNNLNFSTSIEGNRVGMVRLIYHQPQLWSDDVTFGIIDDDQDMVFVDDISPYNAVTTIMSYSGSLFSIWGQDFVPQVVRSKFVYVSENPDVRGVCYTLQPLNLNISAEDSLITIPAGNTFSYDAAIVSNTGYPLDNLFVWMEIKDAENDESVRFGRQEFSLSPYESRDAGTISQTIPSSQVPGNYIYTINCGNYPDEIFDSFSISLRIIPGNGGGYGSWQISRWFEDEQVVENPFVDRLDNNYPNPFNPATTFKYSVGLQAPVKLEIFNLLGQRVKCLVDEVREPGIYTVQWDAQDYSAGVYFYRLAVGKKVFTKRMTLLK
ncbi:MAG: T9SS type A sorting domain-containing protein [candidate division Zixibacteria bacterium]|nr:T9SS type A sorting domain-containing protein [candidate division Zixibacteria bacterium]